MTSKKDFLASAPENRVRIDNSSFLGTAKETKSTVSFPDDCRSVRNRCWRSVQVHRTCATQRFLSRCAYPPLQRGQLHTFFGLLVAVSSLLTGLRVLSIFTASETLAGNPVVISGFANVTHPFLFLAAFTTSVVGLVQCCCLNEG